MVQVVKKLSKFSCTKLRTVSGYLDEISFETLVRLISWITTLKQSSKLMEKSVYQRWFQQHIFTQRSIMLLSSSLMRELTISGTMSCELGEFIKFLTRWRSFIQYSSSFLAHLDENLCDKPFWKALAASGKWPSRRAQRPNNSHSKVNLLWLL